MTKTRCDRDGRSDFVHSFGNRHSAFVIFQPFASGRKTPKVKHYIARMSLSIKTVPRHIAIIMDGNGRWAKSRGLPRIKGHEAGAQAVRECVEGCGELKIEYLTLYAFSAENWQRPKAEIIALMRDVASDGTTISTDITGSSSTGLHFGMPSDIARRPA